MIVSIRELRRKKPTNKPMIASIGEFGRKNLTLDMEERISTFYIKEHSRFIWRSVKIFFVRI